MNGISVNKDWVPHPTHEMSESIPGIVFIGSTPRFGIVFQCKNCGAELAETAAGRAAHKELQEPCI